MDTPSSRSPTPTPAIDGKDNPSLVLEQPIQSDNTPQTNNNNNNNNNNNTQLFKKLFDDYMDRVKSYNQRQQKTIYHATVSALTSVLSSLPAPRIEDSCIDNETAQNIVASKANIDPIKFRKMIVDVELFISDRIYQLGTAAKQNFSRFDTKQTNCISPIQFRAALSLCGVLITDIELSGLVAKFDSEGGQLSVNYYDFLNYLSALREHRPRTAAQDSYPSVLINRPMPNKSQVDALLQLASQTETISVRLDRGLKILRDNLYQKSSNFLQLFQSFQNENRQVAVDDDIITNIYKWGFPQNLCTDDELKAAISQASKKGDGFLSYNEFCSFFMNDIPLETPAEEQANFQTSYLDHPALIDALIKLNHLNLRKIFKDLDTDADGLLTTAELIKGLTNYCQLSSTLAADNNFCGYLETFCSKRKGQFGYADFLRFVNSRLQQVGANNNNNNNGNNNGNNASTHKTSTTPVVALANANKPPMKIDDDATPSQILDAIIQKTRNSGISVEWVLKQLDVNENGYLEEREFLQGLNELNIQLSEKQNHEFFTALINSIPAPTAEDKKNMIEIAEFARILVDPRRTNLQTKTRHNIGGESRVPLGDNPSPRDIEGPTKSSLKLIDTPLREQHFDIKEQMEPLKDGEIQPFKPSLRHLPSANQSSVDLSFNPENIVKDENERPASARRPPGGQSSIDFVNDHNAPTRRPSVLQAQPGMGANLISFDPNAPTSLPPRPKAGQGRSSIVLGDGIKDIPVFKPSVAPLQSPGGNSSINFSAEPEKHKPIQRVLSSPGGKSSISLTHPEENIIMKANTPRPQDKINIDLTGNNNNNNSIIDTPTKRVLRPVQGALAAESNVHIDHSNIRREEDLTTGGRTVRKSVVEAMKSSLSTTGLGNDSSALLVNSFNNYDDDMTAKSDNNDKTINGGGGNGGLDYILLNKIVSAIYGHNSRIRQVFNEFNKSQTSSTLPKQSFQSGLLSLGITVSDDQLDTIYKKYDTDFDGQLTYSDFVKLMSTKQE